MSTLLEKHYQRSIDKLIARFATPSMRGASIQAWLFDDHESRKAAESTLRTSGVDAVLRSAYKPLVHFFLEEIDTATLAAASIGYPVHEASAPNRFLLEAYPLTKLVGDANVEFYATHSCDLTYQVRLTYQDGREASHRVFAPNYTHEDIDGEILLSPTGWLSISHQGQASSERMETDLEQLFHDTIKTISGHAWGDAEPYFEELNIAAQLPIADRSLAYAEETISLTEALHEDIYFSLLEFFQKKSGRPLGDRGLQPGQIVPEISYHAGAPSVLVVTKALHTKDSSGPNQPLDSAQAPLVAAQVLRELDSLGGEHYHAQTRSGRTVHGRYIKGRDVPMMISGAQHANETSGVVGALRAARQLITRDTAHFTISPLENPDGYELHRRLCAVNPNHMHHAARYTAMGDDLEYRRAQELGEKAIRIKAQALTDAKLHVNLHGYPSHEWTRPFSGYIPRGFGMWTLPKGFFLVVRHQPAWTQQVEKLLDHVTRHLATIDGLKQRNDMQLELFERHAGASGFRIVNGFPCLIAADDSYSVPITLITEYPDETIYGENFVRAHTAQMETVLAAYQALQGLF